ncbi:TetR/AcrR family transcriptional regulator [Cellulophaga sp. 20_2_10]|uniref:TetR/AcrR family transcriptional regulator n=1 Tax=Cellulophaga sp. 20_2_10 TaxID=2942476 RepID=UPI00201B2F45|nr:TetR/AcrR family transcriptional regulator [Cellulophaga sp. 20_2_10]
MKHSEVKQNIIETASTLFYRNGYNSTGINEIIAEAGIAKATLYNHFKSKEDICLAYLEFMNVTFIKDIKSFCERKPKGAQRVLALFDFLDVFFLQKDFNGCWCIKTVSEIPKDNERIRREIQNQKTNFIALISNLIADNLELKNNKSLDSYARQIYLLYESAVAESHLHQDSWPIKETKNICSQIIT